MPAIGEAPPVADFIGGTGQRQGTAPQRPGFADLGRDSYEATLGMLAGHYPGEEFADLKPRVIWAEIDREARKGPGASDHAPVIASFAPAGVALS